LFLIFFFFVEIFHAVGDGYYKHTSIESRDNTKCNPSIRQKPLEERTFFHGSLGEQQETEGRLFVTIVVCGRESGHADLCFFTSKAGEHGYLFVIRPGVQDFFTVSLRTFLIFFSALVSLMTRMLVRVRTFANSLDRFPLLRVSKGLDLSKWVEGRNGEEDGIVALASKNGKVSWLMVTR